jgi:hypothetical protein
MMADRTINALLLFFFTGTVPLAAQTAAGDSAFYRNTIQNAISLYHQSFGNQSGLYNGSQYIAYPFKFRDDDHPFFGSPLFLPGTITYDHVLYPDVYLLYDEVSDVVVFQSAQYRIQLVSERIQQFSIAGNLFVRITNNGPGEPAITNGFYQVLYNGERQVLKKEVKVIQEDIRNNSEGVVRYIETKKSYFIKKDNVHIPVKSKSALLVIMKNRKSDIQQYIKSNKLNFKRGKDMFLQKTAAYYDQLTR